MSVAEARPLRHVWGEAQRFPYKTERQCCRCGLVKVTRHEPSAWPPNWTEFWRDGERVDDDGAGDKPRTPACIAIVVPRQSAAAAPPM
jgi:hypothetical protein